MRLASDARLVALIREGRPGAFEVAYDRHHPSILSFCRHMLSDPQEAEDAVQHTFLAAYNGLISSDKPIQLKAWLFTIARNRCYSVLRGRREQPSADLAETATEGLATQVQRRQDLRDLVVDMRRLPEEQRAALVLAELDALSHQQIGVALGVPREKVKALVFQARESLVASRTARETDCAVIRAQLANLRGGALRRANLRRHLRECPGCRDYRRQMDRQRRQLAILAPFGPALALKQAGFLAGTAFKSGLAKGVLGVTLAAVGAGTIAVATDLDLSWSSAGLPPKPRLSVVQGGRGGQGLPLGPARTHTVLGAATLPRGATAILHRTTAASRPSLPATGTLVQSEGSGTLGVHGRARTPYPAGVVLYTEPRISPMVPAPALSGSAAPLAAGGPTPGGGRPPSRSPQCSPGRRGNRERRWAGSASD